MKLLSLDISTKSTGWAVFEDKKLVEYGCITSSSTDLIKRIRKNQNTVHKIYEQNQKTRNRWLAVFDKEK